jgi:hypothetical protein
MTEYTILLSDAELARVEAAAISSGMTVEEFAEKVIHDVLEGGIPSTLKTEGAA